MSRYISLKSFQ